MSKIKETIKGFVFGAAAVPALGLVAHAIHYAGEDWLYDDYSLSHRFETAYSFNTPESHKQYTYQPVINGYSNGEPEKTTYLAHPLVMWPLTLGAGIAGAVGALSEEKRKQEYYRHQAQIHNGASR